MNKKNWIGELNINTKHLENKKPQTKYKIQYIKEYVLYWLKVSVNRPNIININFIDCMCNAGIYADGDLGTSMEILQLFIEEAKMHPSINFYLYLNDNDKNKIKIIKQISDKMPSRTSNIFINYESKDVNLYLSNFSYFNTTLQYSAASILFVDPFDMRSVKINSIREFIQHYYCEVFYNIITNDFTRNKDDSKIFCMLDTTEKITSKWQLIDYISQQLKINKMHYCFSYSFNNLKNSEIYQILFITPNIRGLEKLKEALRTVFKGMETYKNKPAGPELDLFNIDDSNIEENVLLNCGKEAQELLRMKFSSQKVHYSKIKEIILENSVLAENHIIKYVLSPLIEDKLIKKCNMVDNKLNYKDDEYLFYEYKR